MKKSQGDATNANNLEERFDRGQDVLDYFDVQKARVLRPKARPVRPKKASRSLAVREKSTVYPRNKRRPRS